MARDVLPSYSGGACAGVGNQWSRGGASEGATYPRPKIIETIQCARAGGPLLSGCDDTVEAREQVLGVRSVREDDVRRALAARLELPPQHVPVPAALEERRRFVARYFPGDLGNPAGQRESQHDAALGRLGVFYERPPQLLGRAGNQPFDPHDVLHHLSLSGIYGLP